MRCADVASAAKQGECAARAVERPNVRARIRRRSLDGPGRRRPRGLGYPVPPCFCKRITRAHLTHEGESHGFRRVDTLVHYRFATKSSQVAL